MALVCVGLALGAIVLFSMGSRVPCQSEPHAPAQGRGWEFGGESVLRGIVHTSPVAIVVLDTDRVVRLWNPAAERLYGWSAEEVLGRPYCAVPTGKSERYLAATAAAFAGRIEPPYEAQRLRKDGSTVEVRVLVAPMTDGTGHVYGLAALVEDISDLKRAEADLHEREQLAAFQADVSITLNGLHDLPEALAHCAGSLVQHLDAAFARVWTLNDETNVLELQASAGMYTHLDGAHSRVPVGALKIGRIAAERKPHLTNSVIGDPRVGEQEWAMREGMVAFAGYPLVVGNRLMGVMAMFARHPLTDAAIQAMASVANAIALAIERTCVEAQQRELIAILENSSDFISLGTIDGQPRFINSAGRNMVGIAAEDDITSLSCAQLHTPSMRLVFEQEVLPAIRTTGRWEGDSQLVNLRTGQPTDVRMSMFALRGTRLDDPVRIATIQHDITKRLRAEAAIARLASFPEMSPIPIMEVDLGGHVTYSNPAARDLLPDLECDDAIHPWLTDWEAALRTVLDSGQGVCTREVRVGDRWFHQAIYYVADAERMRIYGLDITERKRAETDLISKTALLDAQVDSSIDGILVVDSSGKQILQNARFATLMKLPQSIIEDDDDRRSLDFVVSRMAKPKEFLARVQHLYSHPGEIGRDEIELVDGTIMDRYSCPIIGKDGTRFGRIWAFRDITEQKRAEAQIVAGRAAAEEAQAELESMNQRLEESVLHTSELVVQAEHDARDKSVLLASIPSVLIGTDQHDRVRQWNPAAEALLGVAASDAVGRPLADCGAALDWQVVLSAMGRCRTTQESVRLDDVPFHVPGGRQGVLGISLTPVAMGSGSGTGVLFLGADITERRTLEGQLAQAHKLESIGQLAAGIAHEINTPTQFIADNIAFLHDAFRDTLALQSIATSLAESCRASGVAADIVDALERASADVDWEYLRTEIPSAIEQSKEGVQRVAAIVQAMKEFSHPGVDAKVLVDLNHAVETTVTVARHEWRYAAEVELALDPELPHVPCYPGEVNQVVLNLIVNSAHAVAAAAGPAGEKGCIRLSTRLDGDFAEIQVSDTGTGIPESIRHRVFDPFFTTKAVGKGTGQGLAIAHSVIVDKHGGSIRFETDDGEGTTFFVRLPLREAA